MKLTAFTDYSLRVLIYLATQPGRRATIAEICTAFDVKKNHLTKVVHFLGKAGLLANVRGKGGGLELAMAPADIVVGDVVRGTEGAALPAECFAEDEQRAGNCCIVKVCRLRGVLQEAIEAFYVVLDGYTLEELVENREALSTLMFIDRTASGVGRIAAPGAGRGIGTRSRSRP